MTTVQEAYTYLQDRVNKLSSEESQSISKRQFVFTFNKAQLHWFEERVKVNEVNQIRQEELQRFVTDVCVTPTLDTKHDAYWINMPDNYFRYKRVFGKCGSCDQTVYAYPRSEGNVNRLLQDSNYKPSLEWEETFFTIRDNKIYYYVDNFKCTEITLVYYRCPRPIDMEGISFEGYGTNIHPEIDKVDLQEVIDLTAKIITGDIQDPKYQTLSNSIQQYN